MKENQIGILFGVKCKVKGKLLNYYFAVMVVVVGVKMCFSFFYLLLQSVFSWYIYLFKIKYMNSSFLWSHALGFVANAAIVAAMEHELLMVDSFPLDHALMNQNHFDSAVAIDDDNSFASLGLVCMQALLEARAP